MIGILFALGAAAANGMELLVHRYVSTKEDDLAYACIWMLACSLFFLPLAVIDYRPVEDYYAWFLVLLSCILWTMLNLIYFKQFSVLEVSSSAPLSKVKLIFILILSAVFLNEQMSFEKIAGTALIIGGAFFSSREISLKGLHLSVACSLIMASAFIVDKALVEYFAPSVLGFLLFFIPSLMLVPFIYRKPGAVRKLVTGRPKAVVAAAFFASATYYLVLNAFTMLDASVVLPLIELSTLFAFIGGVLILKEKENLAYRFIGVVLVIAGALIISLQS